MPLTLTLDLDNRPINKADGCTIHAKNVVIDKGYKAFKNEDGFIKEFAQALVSPNLPIIGIVDIPKGYVVFCTDNTNSQIYTYINSTVTLIIDTIYFGFNLNCPIEGVYRYNNKNELIVAFWNGVETDATRPFLLNLTTLPFPSGLNGAYELVVPAEAELARQFPRVDDARIDVDSITDGGNIENGVYSFFLAYEFNEYDITNWSNGTRFIPISYVDESLALPGFEHSHTEGLDSGKAISLYLSNLDTNFRYFKLGVICRINSITTFKEIGRFNISGTTRNLTWTGDTVPTAVSIEEVLVPTISFEKVKTGTNCNRKLVEGNVIVKDPLDYQKYANNIGTGWTISECVTTNPNFFYEKGVFTFYSRNFRFDEVYAIYCYFTYTDGKLSEAFHIPGRAPRAAEVGGNFPVGYHLPTTGTAIDEDALISTIPGIGAQDPTQSDIRGLDFASTKVFHVFDTAMVTGVDGSGYPTGAMGFWENANEIYPSTSDFDIWSNIGDTGNSLQGLNVRHHKFPSCLVQSNSIGGILDLYGTNPVSSYLQNNTAVLGISFNNVYVPPAIASKVQSIHFGFAKRNLNDMTILGEAVLLDYDFNFLIGGAGTHYTFNDFSLCTTQPSISPTFIKKLYEVADGVTGGIIATPVIDDTLSNVIDRVNQSCTYEYPQYGTTIRVESVVPNIGAKVKLAKVFPAAPPSLGDAFAIGTLHQFKTDVFSPFYEQTIVPMGYSYSIPVGVVNYDTYTFNISQYNIHGADSFLTGRQVFYNFGIGFGGVDFRPTSNFYTYSNYQYRYEPSAGFNIGLSPGNDFNYSLDFSALFTEKAPTPFNPYTTDNIAFPFTCYRSIIESDDGMRENWRTFLATDYYTVTRSKGTLWKLNTYNRQLIIHYEFTTYIALLKDKLATATGDAYLGEGDIFDRLPQELLGTDEGYAGCQSQYATVVFPGGHVWCDRQQGKVFHYNGETLDEISLIGVSAFMRSNLNTTIDVDNPYVLFGLTLTYDDEYKRLVLGKRDIDLYNVVAPAGINPGAYGHLTYMGYYDPLVTYNDNAIVIKTGADGGKIYRIMDSVLILLAAPYILDDNFTLSYHIFKKGWVSFHDYSPSYSFYNRDGIHSVYNGVINTWATKSTFRHNYTSYKGKYYDTTINASFVDILFNESPTITKLWESVEWQTEVINAAGVILYNETFTQFMLYNDTQCSDIINLNQSGEWFDAFTGRTIYDSWYFNNFIDAVVNNKLPILDSTLMPIATNVNKNLKDYFDLSKIISKFVAIRLQYSNAKDTTTQLQKDIFINDIVPIITQNFIG